MQRANGDGKAERFGLDQISDRVKFSIEQTARVCSVTRRQLSYWTKKGIISGEKGYNLAAVEKVLLIKKHLDSGSTLRQSVSRTEAILRDREEKKANLEALSGEKVREALTQRLDVIEQDIAKIRRVLPLHTATARLNRIWIDLSSLNLEDVLNRPGQAPVHETLLRLDDAIGQIEEIAKELEEVKAEG